MNASLFCKLTLFEAMEFSPFSIKYDWFGVSDNEFLTEI